MSPIFSSAVYGVLQVVRKGGPQIKLVVNDICGELQLIGITATLGTHDTELAQLAVARGQLEKARQHLHDALSIFSGAHDRNPNELRAMALLTEVDLRLGNTSTANADAAGVVEKARAALSGFPTSAWMGRALQVQGEVLRAQGNTDAAKTTLGHALEMLNQSAGQSAPWTQQTKAALASL